MAHQGTYFLGLRLLMLPENNIRGHTYEALLLLALVMKWINDRILRIYLKNIDIDWQSSLQSSTNYTHRHTIFT
jgi:hypothetical protein